MRGKNSNVPQVWGTLSSFLFSWVVVWPFEVKSSPTVSSQERVMLSVELVCLGVVEANLVEGGLSMKRSMKGISVRLVLNSEYMC